MVPDGSRSAAGVVSHNWGALSLGGGAVSAKGWQVDGQPYQGPVYDVEYFSRRLGNPETEVTLIDVDSETRLSEIFRVGMWWGKARSVRLAQIRRYWSERSGKGSSPSTETSRLPRVGFFGVMK